LQEFLARLDVTKVTADHFEGTCYPGWPGRAFGGQLAAQSLRAATATASPDFIPWSIHAYFHAPVRANEPIDYIVRRVKDGRTTATRQVMAEQDGKLRVTAMVALGESAHGPQHQFAPPDVPGPEHLTPVERLLEPSVLSPDQDHVALGYPAEALVELRIVPSDMDRSDAGTFARRVWMRVLPDIPDDPVTVAAALTYLSDISLGTTALEPHGGRAALADLQLGALELALWFTRAAPLSQWTLFSQDSAYAGLGHGLSHGAFFTASGDVIGIAVQNALMRRPQ
jgi:acyl-CoA thioesterase-2